ncbi:MAG: LacI family DNA-binding transcriptional regulator [Chloroflexota bacterium]
MRKPRETSPTIYDVASRAGLSISTVSRVLNAPEQVNKGTRIKVLTAIDELGYVPKAEARARAMRGTNRIGVLTPFFTAPSFVQRLRGIDAALAPSKYELIIYTVDSLDRLKGYLATLPLMGSLDGLIVMSLPVDEKDAERIRNAGLETVAIEYNIPDFSSVEIDDFQGGQMAAQYLLNKGHRRIAFVGDINPPDYAIRPVIFRYQGFQAALMDAGVNLPENYVISSWYDQAHSRPAARRLLSLPEPPTAIFAAADIQAIAVMKVARDMGVKIPYDLAVLGFDDLDMAEYVGLSTIRQPLDDSGRIAAELLLNRLADPHRHPQHVNLPLTLIEREST